MPQVLTVPSYPLMDWYEILFTLIGSRSLKHKTLQRALIPHSELNAMHSAKKGVEISLGIRSQ